MPEYTPGVPQQPVLITIDGNGFLVIRSSPVMSDGIPSLEIVMSPFEWTKAKLNIDEDELDTSDKGDMYGAITRVYSASSILHLSDNPEKPIWLLLCGFNGEEINVDNPKIFPIIKLRDEVETKDKRIERLEAEIERLRDDNRKLVSLTSEYKEKMRDLFGERPMIPIPEEFLGAKIGKKGVER